MKENFFIKIESLHVADKGQLENVFIFYFQELYFKMNLCFY
jgi:hypothetical protein